MYNQKIYSKKTILSQILFAVFLITALAALILNPVYKATAAISVPTTPLWTGTNFAATLDGNGTTLTTVVPQATTIDYAMVLPVVYTRRLASYDIGDPDEAGALSIKFKIPERTYDKLSFELTGYVKKDKKKKEKIKIEFDFTGYSEADKKFLVNLSVDGGEVGTTGVTEFIDTTVDAGTEFEISYDTGASVFKVSVDGVSKALTKNTDPDTGVPPARDSLRFTNDTANLSVVLDGFQEGALNGSVLFSEINGQALSGSDTITSTTKPVINMDKGVVTAPSDMKAGFNASVNLPFLVTDVVNNVVSNSSTFIFKYYIEIIEPHTTYTPNKPTAKEDGKTIKDNTNVVFFDKETGSGVVSPHVNASDSTKWDSENYYIINIYASNDTSLDALKAAVESRGATALDPPGTDNSANVVTFTFYYAVAKDELAPELNTSEGGYDIVMSPVDEGGLGGVHQDLPELYKDFTFPQPEFKDDTDEKYQLKYTLAYKYESSSQFQKSTSLSFNITQVGWFTFRYIVTDSSGNDTEYREENYTEFKIYFTDTLPPKLTMDNAEITLKKGDKLTTPTPTALDNSSSGATVTVSKMYYKTGVNAGSEVDLKADGLVMNEIGSFEFELYYEAEDKYNNRSTLRTDYLVKVEPAEAPPTNTMLIILIIIGGLSLAGIVALLFIKPIEEPKPFNQK
jgi:hypothetical protein